MSQQLERHSPGEPIDVVNVDAFWQDTSRYTTPEIEVVDFASAENPLNLSNGPLQINTLSKTHKSSSLKRDRPGFTHPEDPSLQQDFSLLDSQYVDDSKKGEVIKQAVVDIRRFSNGEGIPIPARQTRRTSDFKMLSNGILIPRPDANTRAVAEGENHHERFEKGYDEQAATSLLKTAMLIEIEEEIDFNPNDLIEDEDENDDEILFIAEGKESDIFIAEQNQRTIELNQLDAELDEIQTEVL